LVLHPLAKRNIEKEFKIALSVELLVSLGGIVDYPLNEGDLIKLIRDQRHDLSAAFRHKFTPNYEWHLAALRKSYEADPKSVRKVFKNGLLECSDHIRVRYCGVLRELQKTHPMIVIDLIDNVVSTLDLYESGNGGSPTPSGQIIRILNQAFRFSPEIVDQKLGAIFDETRPTVKRDIIRVYGDQLDGDGDADEGRSVNSQLTSVQLIAFDRLFGWTKKERLELDLRGEAASALENASSEIPKAMMSRFDAIFGFLAMLVVTKEPPEPPPKIVIPGDTDDPRLAGLQQDSRRQDWLRLKYWLTRCLQNLIKEQSDIHFATVSGCLENTTANVGEELKKICMTLLGTAGKNYQTRPKVLSLLMRGLMDYESVWVRSTAIDATYEIFRYAKSPPPSNIVDVINVHLMDTFTMVHKAAVQAVSRRPRWFDENQAIEAMNSLGYHLKAYKDDPFQLSDICDAILALANQHQKLWSIRHFRG
jgi:hypothetical protein